MGTGAFSGGKFDFVLVATHSWDAVEKAEWQARFIEASRALYEATEGQVSFGSIFMADESWGLGAAEFVVHDYDSTAYATHGGYGTLGLAIQMFSPHRAGDPRTFVHEFAHHAFGVRDEYTGPVLTDEIDPAVTPPGYITDPPLYDVVPLLSSENNSALLAFSYAFLMFSGLIERRIVNQHTATQVTVFGGFNQDPRTADGLRIVYQPQYDENGQSVGCAEAAGSNFCLMDQYGGSDQATQDDVTEFCSTDNHDSDGDTAHDAAYGGLSCWEVIRQTLLDRYDYSLELPNPAATGDETDEFPAFFDLEKEVRVALVMDRSGSMAEDSKIQGARWGVEMWIRNGAQIGDFLSVIWFDHERERRLPLTNFSGVADLDPVIEDVNAIGPRGNTNIRDALFAAVEEIQSRDGRAAVQAIVLMTDGIHNRPVGTLLQEAIPTLQEAGIPVYVIALGGPEHVDYPALEELVRRTGGAITAVAADLTGQGLPVTPENQQAVIALMIPMISNLLRNGLVLVDDENIGEAPPDSGFAKALREAKEAGLTLEAVAKLAGLGSVRDLVARRRHPHSVSVPFLVEDGALTANFSITYPRKQKFHLHLVDPDSHAVSFGSPKAVLIAPDSPFATALVRKPKPGLWHAVIVRACEGPATWVNYVAGVENRDVVVHGGCDRQAPVGMPVSITAHAVWRDRLSGLRVSARLRGPDGSRHTIALTDETDDEPQSGDYRASFTPEVAGRYVGEIRIASGGKAVWAGSIHRARHAPMKKDEPARIDLRSKAPAFIRRIPIYFDAGTRPSPKDLDEGRSGHRAPARRRPSGVKPVSIDRAVRLVRATRKSGAGPT